MYASFGNQSYNLAHYVFAFLVLMVYFPRLIFTNRTSHSLERFFANYLRIVFLYIIAGYILVVLKLFEVLSIISMMLILSYWNYLGSQKLDAKLNAFRSFAVRFYDFLELSFWFKQLWLRIRGKQVSEVKQKFNYGRAIKSNWPLLLLLVVVAGSAFVRFYDAFLHAAPPMSDSYVTLVWMKYIDQRQLFHDGIYPQGFHIILDYLYKFAAIDQLYVLRYTGPLDGVMIGLGIYFSITRLTENPFSGIIAIALYGLGGEMLHGQDWMRQAATNSQEFAMVFVFPVFYFWFAYVKRGKREDLWTAAAGTCITGLVHSLIYGYVGMGMAVLFGLSVVLNPKLFWKRVWHGCLAGVVSGIVSVLPLGIGELLGKKTNSAAANFLTSKVQVTPPPLHSLDFAALTAIALILFSLLLRWRKSRNLLAEWFSVGLGITSFLLYYYGAAYSHNDVLATRSNSLWVLDIPFSIGFGAITLFSVFRLLQVRRFLEWTACGALIGGLVYLTHLKPITPYKMEWDSSVEQYLRISSMYPHKTWMIFSQNEGYDLVLENGYHDFLRTLLNNYDPRYPFLTKRGETKPDQFVPPDDVYIYHEKNVFEVSQSNSIYPLLASTYKQREQDNQDLEQWITIHQALQHDMDIFYEDKNLVIYHLHRPLDPNDKSKEIWTGKPSWLN